MPKPTVLIVDDEPDIYELMSMSLHPIRLAPRTADLDPDAILSKTAAAKMLGSTFRTAHYRFKTPGIE